jgi:hypothetical protein
VHTDGGVGENGRGRVQGAAVVPHRFSVTDANRPLSVTSTVTGLAVLASVVRCRRLQWARPSVVDTWAAVRAVGALNTATVAEAHRAFLAHTPAITRAAGHMLWLDSCDRDVRVAGQVGRLWLAHTQFPDHRQVFRRWH